VLAEIDAKTHVTGKLNEMPLREREMVFTFDHAAYKAVYGDFTADFKGGELSPFSKKITGLAFDYESRRASVSAISSMSKSQTKTVSFTGRNIRGPYSMNVRDLVPEKSIVKVNELTLPQSDYFIDAFTGEITFSRILSPNDVVVVTYEQRLTGSLNEGNLTGLSADVKSKNGKLSVGVSHLIRQSNRQAQETVDSVSSETPRTNGRYLETANSFIVHWDVTSGSETIVKNGMEILKPNVDYNLRSELRDYEIDALFAQGKFLLKDAPAPTDTFKISYSYYPRNTSITQTVKENLLLDITGTIGYPAEPTIFSGSETIYSCTDVDLVSCPTILNRGLDYVVEEKLNRITFTSPRNIPGVYLRIDYWRYTDVTGLTSDYDHTVSDFRASFAPDPRMKFTAERAVSESDISSKPIQVLNEIVSAASSSAVFCTTAATDANCFFKLSHTDIEAGSVVLYYNDRLSQENTLQYPTDFDVNTSSGELTILRTIPAGSTIIADYRFTPSLGGDLKTGDRNMFSGAFDDGRTQATFALYSGDTYFSPIGGEANLETGRAAYRIAHSFSKNLSLSLERLNITNSTDLAQSHSREYDKSSFSLNWKSKFISSFNLNLDSTDNTDDYSPSQTDTSEDRLSLDVSIPLTFAKNADVSFGYSNSEYTNNTTADTGSKTTGKVLRLNYNPSRKLMLTTQLSSNSFESDTALTTYTSTNTSSTVGMKWAPVSLLTIGVDLDNQRTSDSRPEIAPRSIDQTRVAVTTRPFGKLDSVRINYIRKDSPSITGSSSGSDSVTYSTGIALSNSLTFEPSLSVANSYTGDSSSSKVTSSNYELFYKPENHPFDAALSYLDTTSDSLSSSAANSSKTNNWGVVLNYNPSSVWTYSFTYRADDQSYSNSSDFTTDSYNLKAKRKPGANGSQWLSLQQTSRSGSSTDQSKQLELGADRKLSELLTFELYFRMSDSSNEQNPDRNYTGNLLESTFRASF